MSITIHHGSNGSYKTAGVMSDYFIPAAHAGRVVVTNIRGVDRARTMLNMEDVPDSFDVIYIDTDTREGRYQIATWFHWVPLGALCLFDESGVMFPKAWRQKDFDALDYPGGPDQASADGRPANWVEAWEMHRHFNWDIVLTAPNIKSIREDIRQTTEGAYKHKNRALLGPMFTGYREGYHDAQKNGQSATDFDVVRNKRVNPLVFRLYDSTRTGKAQQTLNGFNLFKSPRVLFALGISVSAAVYGITSGGLQIFMGPGTVPPAQPIDTPAVPAAVPTDAPDPAPARPNAPPAVDPRLRDVDAFSDRPAGSVDSGPLAGYKVWISGSLERSDLHIYHYVLTILIDGQPQEYISSDIQQMGYRIHSRGSCSAEIEFKQERYPISCVALAAREGRQVEQPTTLPALPSTAL
ncbi:zona occludens toxin [Marinobacterium halophilum]|uniref:Zona occludens toxin n=1 Tax=Marinobacterium halophilum TaxID=267374 RepID=A0A2P8ET96_9GAMM|nr:zonular occludens toxin domain-containing protein [Marinobacterium halophilum]PSL12658.1 zona occludens toxin [Marinobacterium halophilum]